MLDMNRRFGWSGLLAAAEGMAADLVLLRGNPLEDVGNVRDPAGVMLRGRWLSGEEIHQRLDAIAAGYGN